MVGVKTESTTDREPLILEQVQLRLKENKSPLYSYSLGKMALRLRIQSQFSYSNFPRYPSQNY